MGEEKSSSTSGKSAKKPVKKRHWAFVTYPESVPDDWVKLLQQTGLQCAISPLHDKDKDSTEENKKPHYHVIVCYSGPTSFNVVKVLTERLNAPNPIPLEQVRGYYRYLTHKDNPEKHQYDEKEIRTVNGFNIADFVELTKSEIGGIKRTLQAMIRGSGLTEYAHLMDYLLDKELYVEYDVASSHTFFFTKYISSKRHLAYMAREEMLGNEKFFHSVIEMVLEIARGTTDVNVVIKELEKFLPRDKQEESDNIVEKKK
jgi:hypothetical protein